MRCPNCSAEAGAGSTECAKCAVVFAKWRTRAEPARVPPASSASFPWLPLLAVLGLAAAVGIFRRGRPMPPEPVAAAPAAAPPSVEPAPVAPLQEPPGILLSGPGRSAAQARQELSDMAQAGMKAKQEALEEKLKDPEFIRRSREDLQRIEEAQHDKVMASQGYYKSETTGHWEKSKPGQYNPK